MKSKRFLSACLSAAMLLGMLPAYAAEDYRIEIQTAEQLCAFSRHCALDTWSQGRTAVLTADIDLSGVEFSPIPTFGGIFDGGGHTISGLAVARDGSLQGLFRCVQAGALVRDLKVSGRVAPGGSASTVGGIVGRNYGTLQGCSFSGIAVGKNNVGGIVGINEGTGELVSCTASGTITGEHFTGGIAGQNLGAVVSCENRTQVNTQEEAVSVSLGELNWEQVNSTENVRAHTDSGGIAGYSSGIVQSCTNYGAVGYPHTGYNVGGIVGRQSGFLDGCINEGPVYGRKDVGGIAGQLEPYLLLRFSEDSLQKLDGELDTLGVLVRRLGDEASLAGDLFNLRADALAGEMEQVRSDAHKVAGWTDDYLEGTADTVNELSARVTRTFDRLEPVFDALGNSGDGLADAFRRISILLEDVDEASIWGEEAAADARIAFDRMGNAMDDAQDALRAIREAIQALRRNPADQNAIDEARVQLAKAMEDLRRALEQAGAAPDALAEVLYGLEQSGGVAAGDTIAGLKALAAAFRQAAQAVGALWDGISGILTGVNGPSLGDRLHESLALLRQGVSAGMDAMDALRHAAGSLNDSFDSLEILSGELDGMVSGMAQAFSALEDAMDAAGGAARGLEALSRELAGDSVLALPALNSEYTTAVDRIFDALDRISDEAGGLRTELRDSGDRMQGAADAVGNQLGVVSDLLMEGYHEAIGGREEGEHIEDISDTDDNGRQGRVSHAVNRGAVQGDVDVGGIAGAMAVEYDLDPEDDIVRAGQRSANFRYQTRAVITGCRNEGEITAKKNYAGGIAGRMDLGRISDCEGYGSVTSTDGAYVGGLAGASSAAIRDSWVKCALSGEDYIGGVVGMGHDLSSCRVMAGLTASGECIGAVAGDADGLLTGNVFVGSEYGAVDGVSYAGRAEPVSYDALLAAEGLPDAFRSFTITFLVDGALYKECFVNFGETLEEVPEPPARDGQFGEWSDADFSDLQANKTVEAIYYPFITVLESGAGPDGKSLLLVEGEFDHRAALTLSPAEGAPAGAPGEAYHVVVSPSAGSRSGHILHVLAGEEDNTVWLAQDGRWRRKDSVRDGSYLIFSVDGDEAVFCLSHETNRGPVLLLTAGGALLLLAALLRSRRRKKRVSVSRPAPVEQRETAGKV